jgi:hypothetical protein
MFHVVGVACIAATMAGLHGNPTCLDYQDTTKGYPSMVECRAAADKTKVPIPKGFDTWVVLHCAQAPARAIGE